MKKMIGCMVGCLALSAQAVTLTGVFDSRVSPNARVAAGTVALGTPSGAVGTSWNSAAYADGWQTVTSEGCSTNLLALNRCAVRGGRLAAHETWPTTSTNVLQHSVIVPSGVTLTVGLGAIVKCTPGTAIEVVSGGTLVLQGATLADIADDAVGGDTNDDGAGSAPTATAEDFVSGAGAPSITRVALWNGGSQEGLTRWYTAGQCYGALPTLVKDGFRFDGWYTAAEGGSQVTATTAVPSVASVASVSSLHARWTAYTIGLDATEADVAAAGGDYAFGISANTPWTVTQNGASWITLATASGSGNGTVSYTVAANGSTSARSATITVTGAGLTREFTVRQAGCEGVATPTITPADGTEFAGSYVRCAIRCATAGATIHYTRTGKDPDARDPVYGGVSFNIFGTTTIKARAYKDGLAASGIATARIVKKQTLGDALDVPLWTVTNDADAPWTIDDDETYGSKASVRSGVIGCDEETAITTTLSGAGTLKFWWKVSCEDSPDEDSPWDYLACLVDGVAYCRIDGESGWLQQTVTLGDGEHTIAWLYHKDGMDDEGHTGRDCGWVDSVSWTPGMVSGISGMSESWLQNVGAASGMSHLSASEIAASDPDGDGLTVEQEYVAGTDPNDPDSKFTARIEMVDGEAKITWEPDLQGDEQPRAYKTYGSKDLKTWEEIPQGQKGDYNFFKVSVEMQE